MIQTKKLNASSLTSGLAGAATLAAGTAAYGSVVVVSPPPDMASPAIPGANPGPGQFDHTSYDINNDGIVDFGFTFRHPGSASGVVWQADVWTVGAGTGIDGYVGPYALTYANRLASGASIGGANPWQAPAG